MNTDNDIELVISVETYDDNTVVVDARYEDGNNTVPMLEWNNSDGSIDDCIDFLEEMIKSHKQILTCVKAMKKL